MIYFLLFIIYIIYKYKIARGHLKGDDIRQKSTHNYVEKFS